MPSIQDVADQINAKLDQITTNTGQTAAGATQTAANTDQIRDRLDTLNAAVQTLDNHLVAGLSNLAAGLFAIWEVDKASLAQLRHHSAQHDTMICLQENTNDLLCGITRKLTAQLELTRAIAESADRVEGIAERAEPAAAGDYDRLERVRDRLAACCPPPRPEPEPCPTACDKPTLDEQQPKGQDWKPLDPKPRESSPRAKRAPTG